MRIFINALSRLASTFVLLLLFNGCAEETANLGNIEYALKNTSEINIGFNIHLVKGAEASIIKDSAIIKPGEEFVIIKSRSSLEPDSIIDKIEIWDKDFNNKYKELALNMYEKENDRYIFSVTMPFLRSAEIIRNSRSVDIYINENSIYGFYPKIDYPRATYFFKTTDHFNSIFKIETPVGHPNASFKMLKSIGSTLIGYDANVYSDNTLFIKSTNGGTSWETFFEFGLRSSDDSFATTDFIDEDNGWLFNYRRLHSGWALYTTDVYRYSSGNIYNISTINNYSVYDCKFINENIGYVLANTSNGVRPSDARQTIFMKTDNGGIKWSAPVIISNNHFAQKFFRLNDGKLIVMLNSAEYLLDYYMFSLDDGKTWKTKRVKTTNGIKDIFFLPNGVGYLKAGTTSGWAHQNIGEVYKTLDGGTTWTKITEPINGTIIWFYNENIGYLQDLKFGSAQILYVTTDGGSSWKEVLYPYDYLIN